MLIISITLFAVAALLGFYLLSFVLQHKETPKGIAFIHGPIAATALVFLIIYASLYEPVFFYSALFFILAALGGLTLIYRDLTGKSLPGWLALGHGLIAATGFILLIIFYFL